MAGYKDVVAKAISDAKVQLAEIAQKQSFKLDKDGKPTAERHAPHQFHREKCVESAVAANTAAAVAALKADVAAGLN